MTNILLKNKVIQITDYIPAIAGSIWNEYRYINDIHRPSTCSCCNKFSPCIVAHHPNYFEPLEIIWLCGTCHDVKHKIENVIYITKEEVMDSILFRDLIFFNQEAYARLLSKYPTRSNFGKKFGEHKYFYKQKDEEIKT